MAERTILLIEDEQAVAGVMRLTLQRSGYQALLAASVAEARLVWQAYRDKIALVITDNSLPDGSGTLLAKDFQRERPSLKVILASGRPQSDVPASWEILDKPFEFARLLNTVHRLIGTDAEEKVKG